MAGGIGSSGRYTSIRTARKLAGGLIKAPKMTSNECPQEVRMNLSACGPRFSESG